MGNLIANGVDYPFVQWQPAEASGVQHTDQEFTDGNGNSFLFRTYNAQYSAPNWTTITPGVNEAYATVQNPDGSAHYYSNYNPSTGVFEPTWANWFGSDNNTIYNSVDFGVTAGGIAASNSAAFSTLFTTMGIAPGSELKGGLARIPQDNFPVVATSIAVPDQVILQALGTAGPLLSDTNYHFTITDSSAASALFVADGSHSLGGTEFRNLAFYWYEPAYQYDTVLNAGFAGTLLYRCTFKDCPTAVNFAGFASENSPDALGSSMVQCQIHYDSGPSNATCVVLAGQQTSIIGGIYLQAGVYGGGPTGCTAVTIGGGTQDNEHNIIDGVHFTDWTICVDYQDTNGAIKNGTHSGCEYTTISNCEMDGFGYGRSTNPQSGHWGACINLTTYSNTGKIYGQKIIGNTLSISQDSSNANPIVLIDTGTLGYGGVGGPNTDVSSIDLIGNLIFSNITSNDKHHGMAQPNTYGIQINAGDGIRVIGGKIGNMGTMAGSDGSADICISGDPGSVLIDSVDLRPTFANAGGGASGSAASEYALLISGALTNAGGAVRVTNCDMTGYSGNPVGVTGSVGFQSLFIINCAGYNQDFDIFSGATSAAPVLPTSASTAGTLTGGYNFYGPSTIYFSVGSGGSVTLTINGVGLTFPANSSQAIFLSSPYDEISFGATVNLTLFRWIGA